MFDIGWTEMLIVAIITVLFVGPRELPAMLRAFAQFIKTLKSMAGEFQSQFSKALHQSELDELKNVMNEPVKIDSPDKPKNKSSGKNAVPGFSSGD